MTLGRVLQGVAVQGPVSDELQAAPVSGLDYDSRKVHAGFLFFAFPGARVDGRAFATQALDAGALAIVSELDAPAELARRWIRVAHGRQALATAAANFYGHPDQQLCLTGVTGTNGKTTTSFLVDSLLRHAGKTTALVGTIEYRVGGEVRTAVNTTPDSLDLFRMFVDLEQLGGTHVTMEVSSHALSLGRVFGINFHTAIFTNLTRDHLDFHGDMDKYFAAKQLLFDPPASTPRPKFAVVNGDDEYGRALRLSAGTERILYGFDAQADLRGSDLQIDFDGLRFVAHHQGKPIALRSPLVGKINAYNILAACGAALSYGLSWDEIARGLENTRRVPGRFETVEAGQPFLVVVDYAHTDDALQNVIRIARDLTSKRVITLFGCGGDRDRTKRPLMAKAAAENSDFVVLTSDNPRSEDPLAIINDAMVGLRRSDTPYLVEPDRLKAIRAALSEAQAGDVVILAGKGHEPYQILKDRTIHFDDREEARQVLRGFGYEA